MDALGPEPLRHELPERQHQRRQLRDGRLRPDEHLRRRPNTFGGVLIGDFDDPTGQFNNNTSLTCFRFQVCETGVQGIPGEVNIGGGDSGSAAFLAGNQTILGVASFGSRRVDVSPIPPFGAFGTAFGYACVANIAGNAVCAENFNFVNNLLTPTNVIPEPSTYALMATGLVGLAGFARRRNKKA
ncbi:MAG: PEP-CTERM sorting domain-containing protein [Gemmatimonadaceae bacterium]|nr:PEP-CTERM sorting domain-containing protein [Gemmatimonadaceae bacterium]